jgi:uncharacterized heparinase superfamily protein
VNWIKWARAGNALSHDALQSLAVQARWLSRRLEVHLLGNHLFVNAKALVFVGLFFEGPEAARWLDRGLRILARQVDDQILADGGQFELSPMYHALALEDVLDLCNVAAAYADAIPPRWRPSVGGWRRVAPAMRRWMLAMRHPDGEIGFFNDAAIGIAAPPDVLEHYAVRLGLGASREPAAGVTALAESGYLRVEVGAVTALLDVGPIGPDHLPAHAHADTLSFELSLNGQRVFVNSGTSRYGSDAERLRQRGTAAHNTVVVDGYNSSDVWGGFRVARRARPIGLTVATEPEIVVRCAHDGYHRLPGRPEHGREWSFSQQRLVVTDHVSGQFGSADARFHLHPQVAIETTGGVGDTSSVALRLPDGHRVHVDVEVGRLEVVPATWHPEFGQDVATRCLVVRLDGATSRVRVVWPDAA